VPDASTQRGILVVALLALTAAVLAGCGSTDGPVAKCGPSGVLRIDHPNSDVALIVCQNGHVYEVAVS
jgi:hypothetical protein